MVGAIRKTQRDRWTMEIVCVLTVPLCYSFLFYQRAWWLSLRRQRWADLCEFGQSRLHSKCQAGQGYIVTPILKSNNNKNTLGIITTGQELSVMAYLLSSDSPEAKVGRLWVGGQPGLCRKIWSQQTNGTMLPPGEMNKGYASFLWIFAYKCMPYVIISKWKPDLEKITQISFKMQNIWKHTKTNNKWKSG